MLHSTGSGQAAQARSSMFRRWSPRVKYRHDILTSAEKKPISRCAAVKYYTFLCAITFFLIAVCPSCRQSMPPGKNGLISDDISREKRSIDCDMSQFKRFTLHFFIKKVSRTSQNLLGEKIAADGITVLFHEYSDETDEPLIAVEISDEQFKKKFNGSIDVRLQPYSSRNSHYCRIIIKHYRIPGQYISDIKRVQLPDPQQY